MITLKEIADSDLFKELSGSDESGCLDQVRLSDLASSECSYPVRILGTLSEELLLVSYPSSASGLVPIRKNQVFNARRFDGRSFYEFSSEVVEMSFGPIPHLIISVPSDSRSKVKLLRDSVRRPVNLPVTMSSPGSLVHGVCANISSSGALVLGLAKPEFKEGVMSIALPVLGRKIIANIPVDLMREDVQFVQKSPVYVCGLRFGQKSDITFLALDAFLKG